MKLIISEAQLNTPPEIFLRQAGYAYIANRHGGDDSFVRSLSGNFYPRFHVYIKREQDQVVLNIHLDQKKPSYGGVHMHNGEYDGEVVEEEVRRLKNLIKN
jgi:hypothetical protein